MKKKLIASILTVVALSSFSVYAWSSLAILPFEAVIHNGQGEDFLAEVSIEKEEMEAIGSILKKYGEPYRIKGDRILVSPKLYFDKDLRWNYTTKSKKDIANQASHTMSANARHFHIDPMEINLNKLGNSIEAAIVWI